MNPAESLPQHIAVIMDGNGRWAEQRQLPLMEGHRAGMKAAKSVIKQCSKKHVPVLSLFTFSSENWNRSTEEVNYLMDLFLLGLAQEIDELHANHVQLRFIGDRTKLNSRLTQEMLRVEQLTRHNTDMVLLLAVDYGGQWDILQATRSLLADVETGRLKCEALTTEAISERLSFADLPNPDLFIRTSGEMRISNFMLWQLAYAELYFTPILWPDFHAAELDHALNTFANRERRYGGRLYA